MTNDPLTRLMKHVSKDPSGCWLWIGYKSKEGYGRFHLSVDARAFLAHRASYILHRGEIPDGLHLDHLCCVRACVNPDHLEPVSQAENNRRGGVMGLRSTHCVNGHEWTEENTGRFGARRYCRMCQRTSRARRRKVESA